MIGQFGDHIFVMVMSKFMWLFLEGSPAWIWEQIKQIVAIVQDWDFVS